jgi:hypothetical protein
MSKAYDLKGPSDESASTGPHGPANTEIDPKRTQTVRQLYEERSRLIDAIRTGDPVAIKHEIYIDINEGRLEKR